MSKRKPLPPFLERIVNFDFDRFYTRKRRIIIHVSMWAFYTLLTFLNYRLGYNFGFVSSFLFSLRLTLCNIVVFYLFFYVIIPYTFKKNYFLLLIISVPILIQIWLGINHSFYKLLYVARIKVDFGILEELIRENYETSILDKISPKNVLAHTFEVLTAISPFFFTKIAFDLSRIFAKSIKASREIEKLDRENLIIENRFLHAQLNPHFLFNTLNNLYSLALKQDKSVPGHIIQLSEIMGYTLYDSNVEFIPLNKELTFISSYFDMEKIRFSRDFPIQKEIINKGSNDLKIAPLLSFVFVENAFKYGLKSENPYLKLFIEIRGKSMYFHLENDISFDEVYPIEKRGIGIKNAKRRLQLLYPGKYTLNIGARQERFLVDLNIELE